MAIFRGIWYEKNINIFTHFSYEKSILYYLFHSPSRSSDSMSHIPLPLSFPNYSLVIFESFMRFIRLRSHLFSVSFRCREEKTSFWTPICSLSLDVFPCRRIISSNFQNRLLWPIAKLFDAMDIRFAFLRHLNG